MFVNLIKFIHILVVLGLVSLTAYCFKLTTLGRGCHNHSDLSKKYLRINQFILLLLFLGMATGTLLVYPKHFTFHTPWIRAAYELLTVGILLVALMLYFQKYFLRFRFVFFAAYFLLSSLFIIVIHDAVTKLAFVSPF